MAKDYSPPSSEGAGAADKKLEERIGAEGLDLPVYDNEVRTEEQTYAFDDSRKIGITGAGFLILNKMVGTGSKSVYIPWGFLLLNPHNVTTLNTFLSTPFAQSLPLVSPLETTKISIVSWPFIYTNGFNEDTT